MCGVSGSHQHGINGVQQVFRCGASAQSRVTQQKSQSPPRPAAICLGPWTLKSCPRRTVVGANTSCLPTKKKPLALHKLGCPESQDVTRLVKVRFGHVGEGLNTGKIAAPCWLYWKKAQHKDNGSFPSIPCPEATPQSLSLYVSGTSLSCSPFAGAQTECLGVKKSICGPFKRVPGFPAALYFTQMDEIPDDFHS